MNKNCKEHTIKNFQLSPKELEKVAQQKNAMHIRIKDNKGKVIWDCDKHNVVESKEKYWKCEKHQAVGNHEMGCPHCHIDNQEHKQHVKRVNFWKILTDNKYYYYVTDTLSVRKGKIDILKWSETFRMRYKANNVFLKKTLACKAANALKITLTNFLND